MAITKAKTIKLNDLAGAIDVAVRASAGKKLPGSTILGRVMTTAQAAKLDVNAIARDITRQVQGATDAKLTPKVNIAGGIVTMGFIIRPTVEFNR